MRVSKRSSGLVSGFDCRFHAVLVLGCLMALAVGPHFDVAAADCIDYGDYLHWAGGVDTPDFADGVAVSGTHAYVADWGSGLQVIDITNPASPQIVGSVDTPDYALGVAVSGTHAYVGDESSGLQVIDITNPASPVIVGSVDTPDYALGVAVSGTHAYVADGSSGLQVIDVTNPASPQIVGSVDTPDYALGVAVSGTHAYVGDESSGLQVIDITNPSSPVIVGSVDTPDYAYGVAVSGTHAYVTDLLTGLQVIDITNPASPQIVGSVDTPGEAYGVAVSGTHAYMADGNSGLQVLPAQCEGGADAGDNSPSVQLPRLDVRPNPGSSHASIHFTLSANGPVRASVHDIAGRRVRSICDTNFSAGSHEVFWDGKDDLGRAAPAGVYLVRIAGPEGSMTTRFVMIR